MRSTHRFATLSAIASIAFGAVSAAQGALPACPGGFPDRAPIDVSGNDELAAVPGIQGSGTSLDPYRITSFRIADAPDAAVRIDSTDAHLVISNFCVTRTGGAGVALFDTRNVTVRDGFAYGSGNDAIDVDLAEGIRIEGMEIEQAARGARIERATDVVLRTSRIRDTTLAVDIPSSSQILVDGNVIDRGKEGIAIHPTWTTGDPPSRFVTVSNNVLANLHHNPLTIYKSTDVEIVDNEIRDTLDEGVELLIGTERIRIVGNEILRNADGGIKVEGAIGDVEILDNLLDGNRYGILLNCPADTLVQNNRIRNHVLGPGDDAWFAGNGIYVCGTDGMVVRHNEITNNTRGILSNGCYDCLARSNRISANDTGIVTRAQSRLGACENDIAGNAAGADAAEMSSPHLLFAESNWWGSSTGPSGWGPGIGDSVTENVDYADYRASSRADAGTLPPGVPPTTRECRADWVIGSPPCQGNECPSNPTCEDPSCDETPPVISWESPRHHSVYVRDSAGVPLTTAFGTTVTSSSTVIVRVQDALSGVAAVEFSVDGVPVDESAYVALEKPRWGFRYDTTGAEPGWHEIRMRAVDGAGNETVASNDLFVLDLNRANGLFASEGLDQYTVLIEPAGMTGVDGSGTAPGIAPVSDAYLFHVRVIDYDTLAQVDGSVVQECYRATLEIVQRTDEGRETVIHDGSILCDAPSYLGSETDGVYTFRVPVAGLEAYVGEEVFVRAWVDVPDRADRPGIDSASGWFNRVKTMTWGHPVADRFDAVPEPIQLLR